MSSFINEAFTELTFLNEDEIDLTDKDMSDKLSDVIEGEVEDSVEISDLNAETEEDLEDSYVGKIIFECPVCKSLLYKDVSEVQLDAEEEVVNNDEECPFCFSTNGFKVVGQVADYPAEEDVDITVENSEDDEEYGDDFMEALNQAMIRLTEAEMSDEDRADSEMLRAIERKIHQRSNAALTAEEKALLAKYGVGRNGHVLFTKGGEPLINRTRREVDKVNLADRARKRPARTKVLRDLSVDYFYNDPSEAHDDWEDTRTFQAAQRRAQNSKMTAPHREMRQALSARTSAQSALDNVDAGYQKKYDELDKAKEFDSKYYRRSIDSNNAQIKKLLRKESIEKPLGKMHKGSRLRTEDLATAPRRVRRLVKLQNEDLESVHIETDSEVINVEPKISDVPVPGAEPIVAPVTLENEEKIEDTSEVDYDVDEFDEESFDELGEGYLKKVYENVNSFKTSAISRKDNSLIVEGNITFASGATKKTAFLFEAHTATKSGKLRFIGENQQITRGKKAFQVTGKLDGSKFVAESLAYNYSTKDPATNQSTRINGTLRRAKK